MLGDARAVQAGARVSEKVTDLEQRLGAVVHPDYDSIREAQGQLSQVNVGLLGDRVIDPLAHHEMAIARKYHMLAQALFRLVIVRQVINYSASIFVEDVKDNIGCLILVGAFLVVAHDHMDKVPEAKHLSGLEVVELVQVVHAVFHVADAALLVHVHEGLVKPLLYELNFLLQLLADV